MDHIYELVREYHRLFSKLWALSGLGLYYCTYYLGGPKWDPNFRNYPHNRKLLMIVLSLDLE